MPEIIKKTKIQVRAWPMAANAINYNLRGLHIRRDSYLNDLFDREIDNLEAEVDFLTPDDLRLQIKRRLQDLRPEDMTIALNRDVASRMHRVLKGRNISRNAFINRVLFFLVARPAHLDRLGISYIRRTDTEVKPLGDAWSNLHDPFYNIRSANGEKFYTLFIDDRPLAKDWPSLFALNCAVSAEFWEMAITPPTDFLADLGIGEGQGS